MSGRTKLITAQRNRGFSPVSYAHQPPIAIISTNNQTNSMIINLPFPKWLARKLARLRPQAVIRPQLKRRQILPTLPEQKRYFVLSK
jgi:hypothetical protein